MYKEFEEVLSVIREDTKDQVVEIEVECQDCVGTGLTAFGVTLNDCVEVCRRCKGTGKTKLVYKKYSGKRVLKGTVVKRVFANTNGFVHYAEDTEFLGIPNAIKFSEAGCTYDDWLLGESPKPVKDLYCPYVWDRSTEICNEDSGLGIITDCKYFSAKAACWERYELEQANTQVEKAAGLM